MPLCVDRARQLFFAAVFVCFAGAVGGCAVAVSALAVGGQAVSSRSEDVTAYDVYQGQRIWSGYSRGGTYQLKRDVFYGVLYSNPLRLDDLIPPAHPLSTIPRTIESYKADPAKWPAIKGVVPAGTRLRVIRVMYAQDLNIHDFYYVGAFDDGPIANRELLLNAISLPKVGMGNPRLYDPDTLERVSAL